MPSDRRDGRRQLSGHDGARRRCISMMSIALGMQTGLLLWRAAVQLAGAENRRVLHD